MSLGPLRTCQLHNMSEQKREYELSKAQPNCEPHRRRNGHERTIVATDCHDFRLTQTPDHVKTDLSEYTDPEGRVAWGCWFVCFVGRRKRRSVWKEQSRVFLIVFLRLIRLAGSDVTNVTKTSCGGHGGCERRWGDWCDKTRAIRLVM